MLRPRRPRFARVQTIPPIHITDRDIEILRAVARHRFLRSTHVVALLQQSRQQVLRRLQMLFQHGFLDRPRCQIDYYRRGSRAMVYGIGNHGAQLLEERCGIPRRKVDWSAKNRTVNRYFMEHSLAVADVMVALEIAAQKRNDIRITAEDTADIKWSVPLKERGTTTQFPVVPDKIFKVESTVDSRSALHVLLEVDRATMPVMRQTLKQTSVYRKFIGYQKVWRENLHSRFGMSRVRVLTVTTTPERVVNLVEAAQQLRESTPGLFLFTHTANLALNPDPLNARVLNAAGKEVRLAE